MRRRRLARVLLGEEKIAVAGYKANKHDPAKERYWMGRISEVTRLRNALGIAPPGWPKFRRRERRWLPE